MPLVRKYWKCIWYLIALSCLMIYTDTCLLELENFGFIFAYYLAFGKRAFRRTPSLCPLFVFEVYVISNRANTCILPHNLVWSLPNISVHWNWKILLSFLRMCMLSGSVHQGAPQELICPMFVNLWSVSDILSYQCCIILFRHIIFHLQPFLGQNYSCFLMLKNLELLCNKKH